MAPASSLWSGLSATAGSIRSVAAPNDAGSDGLTDLQRHFHSQAKIAITAGFGSDIIQRGAMGSSTASGMGNGSADLLGLLFHAI
mmetsp:Transcript_22522/g.48521  ORF Transcript_22522/g.48521 Transcript_22522/m.48521 type:complete len:85 (+) Transcript_22522:58-312(+)